MNDPDYRDYREPTSDAQRLSEGEDIPARNVRLTKRVEGIFMLRLAAIVVVVAGIKAASEVLVPVLLSTFVVLAASPLLLRAGRPPSRARLVLVLVLILGVLAGLAWGGERAIAHLTDVASRYDDDIREHQLDFARTLRRSGLLSFAHSVQTTRVESIAESVLSSVLSAGPAIAAGFMFVVLLAGFMIWETPAFPARISQLSEKTGQSFDYLRTAVASVHQYLYVKSVVSVLTGVLAGFLCWMFGVDGPVVWGCLAFVLNYVPNVGSLVAAIPPVAFAFLEHGVPSAVAVAIGYLVINTVVGNILEPKMTGDAVRLSPVVVLLSLVFWGWALGPVGALLSVPLTVIVRIVAVRTVSYSWLSVLLEPASTLTTSVEGRGPPGSLEEGEIRASFPPQENSVA